MFWRKYFEKKGYTISFMIVLPLVFLLGAYGIIIFIQSGANNRNIRKIYNKIKAQYAAVKTLEYVFLEITRNSYSDNIFTTHTLDLFTGGRLLAKPADAIPDSDLLPGAAILDEGVLDDNGNENYVYALREDAGATSDVIAYAKVYQKSKDYYALIKTVASDPIRLFFGKIEGISMYNFAAFYSDDAAFGWQTINANGGGIHANGNIKFNESVTITDVSELSTAGKFYWEYSPLVYPGEGGENTLYPSRREPYIYPNDGLGGGNYINKMDGHFAGERRGLLACNNASCGVIEEWNPTDSNQQPIWPWGDREKFVADSGWSSVNWHANSSAYQYAYLEQDPKMCKIIGNCANDDPVGYNGAYYEKNVNILGKYIPSRLPGAPSYEKRIYLGDHDNPASLNLTDSDAQSTAWNNFLTSVELDDVLKDRNSGGHKFTVPDINILQIMQKSEENGLLIKAGDQGAVQEIKLNGRSYSPPINSIRCTTNDGKKEIFRDEVFINNKYGVVNKTLVLDMGVLIACEEYYALNGGIGPWVPESNIIMLVNNDPPVFDSPYPGDLPDLMDVPLGLTVENAKQLPEGGLSYFIQGDFTIVGDYNDPVIPEDKQPSAAIVSNKVNLVSEDFDFPKSLPMPQHHLDYPYEGAGAWAGLPAGTGFRSDFGLSPGFDVLDYYYTFADDDPANWPKSGTVNPRAMKMAHAVSDDVRYNISLAGHYAVEPDFLERWGYFETPVLQPSYNQTWIQKQAFISGSMIQLDTETFQPVGHVDVEENNRDQRNNELDAQRYENPIRCFILNGDGTGCDTPWNTSDSWFSNNTKRTRTDDPPSDFLITGKRPEITYDADYANVANYVPPDELAGFFTVGLVQEIPYAPFNWTNCPDQCIAEYCGDGFCNAEEDPCNCEDCGTSTASCGNETQIILY
ncbi:MAG: hypothetical protein ABIJ41_08395 [Candidatus Omnitrophota bacterium]